MTKRFLSLVLVLAMVLTLFAGLTLTVHATDVTDELVATAFVATNTTYKSFTGVTFTSDAVYAGNNALSAYSNVGGAIQLRNNTNGHSGIVSTTSGGTLKSVTVTWGTNNTNTSRKLTVYGKNTAYTGSSDLYDASTRGTEIGSITINDATTLTVPSTSSYQYIGLLANGAMYIDQIDIVWDNGTGADPTQHVCVWSDWTHNANSNPSTHTRTCSGTVGTCPEGGSQTEECTFVESFVIPTANAVGGTLHTCSVCGYNYLTDEIPARADATYELATSIAAGDTVVIFSTKLNKVMSEFAYDTGKLYAADCTDNGNDTITAAAAMELTVEAATGGWYLKSGSKYLTYDSNINTRQNLVLADAASTDAVWTWDSTNKRLQATNGTYTYSNNTYDVFIEGYTTGGIAHFTTYSVKSGNTPGDEYTMMLYKVPVAPSDDVDIYIVDQTGGLTNYYAWNSNDTSIKNADWPGAALPAAEGTDKDNNPYYKITLDKTVYDKLILNKGNGQPQSGNLDWAATDLANSDGNYVVYYAYMDNNNVGISSPAHADIWLAPGTYTAPTCTENGFTSYPGLLTQNTNDIADDPATTLGHNWGAWTSNNDGTHSRVCANDSTHVETAACTYENGACTICGYTEPSYVYYAIGATLNGKVYIMPSAGTGTQPAAKEVTLNSENKVNTADAAGYQFKYAVTDATNEYFTLQCDNNMYLNTNNSTSFQYSATPVDWVVDDTIGLHCIGSDNARYIRLFTNTSGNSSFRPYSGAQNGTEATYLIPIGDAAPVPVDNNVDIYIVDQTGGLTNYYAWNSADTSIKNADWPGAALPAAEGTDKDNNPYYKITLDKTVYDKLILNKGNGQPQTGNLDWVATDLANSDGNYVVYYAYMADATNVGVSSPAHADIWLAPGTYTGPTCTENGYTSYPGLLTQSTNDIADDPATTLGHTYTYAYNNNNTHTGVCGVCGDTITEACTFVNGVCTVCQGEEVALPSYEKVTAEPTSWAGTYVLVYEADVDNAYVWNGTDSVSDYTEAAIDSGRLVTGAPTLTIAAVEGGGYTALINGGDNDGKYLNDNGDNNNGLKFSAAAVTLDIAYDTTTASTFINVNGHSSARLAFNSSSGQTRFRFFKTSTIGSYAGAYKAVQLYKLVETTPAVQEDSSLVYDQVGFSVAGTIKAQFAVYGWNHTDPAYDSYYIIVTHHLADGTSEVSGQIPLEANEYSGYTFYVGYYDVHAKYMADDLDVTVYGVKDGVTYQGPATTTSIREIAADAIEGALTAATPDQARATVYADMLAYGAAAQVKFNYNTNDLANALTGDDLTRYNSSVTSGNPAFATLNTTEETPANMGTEKVTFYTVALSVEERVYMQFGLFFGANDVNDFTIELKIGDRTVDVADDKLVAISPDYPGYYALIVDSIDAIESQAIVSVTVYEGTTPVSVTQKNSIENLAASKTGDDAPLASSMVNFYRSIAAVV